MTGTRILVNQKFLKQNIPCHCQTPPYIAMSTVNQNCLGTYINNIHKYLDKYAKSR